MVVRAFLPEASRVGAAGERGDVALLARTHDTGLFAGTSSVVRITGMALEWIGSTIAFGPVVRKSYTRCGPGIGFDLVPRSAPAAQ